MLEDGREHGSCHPVRGVDDDAERSNRVDVDERKHLGDEAGPHVLAAYRSSALDLPEARFGSSSDLRESGVASDRERAATDDLHPGVLLRVVRRGDADAAVEAELGNRVVEHLRPHEPELDGLGARVGEAVHDSREDRRRRQAHVVPDGGARGSKCSAYARATRYAPSSSSSLG